MTFLIQCDNKGCFKLQNAQLNVETDQVHCADCNNVIKNITVFAKRQLKALGQTTKNQKTTKSFAVKCNHCDLLEQPTIEKNEFLCSGCKKPLQISEPFKLILKENLKNANKPI